MRARALCVALGVLAAGSLRRSDPYARAAVDGDQHVVWLVDRR
jgi:hypothetical protein